MFCLVAVFVHPVSGPRDWLVASLDGNLHMFDDVCVLVRNGQTFRIHKFRRNMGKQGATCFHLVFFCFVSSSMCRNIVAKSPRLQGAKMRRTSRGGPNSDAACCAKSCALFSCVGKSLVWEMLGIMTWTFKVFNHLQSFYIFYAILCPHTKHVLVLVTPFVPLLTFDFMAACHQRGSLWWILGLEDHGSDLRKGTGRVAIAWLIVSINDSSTFAEYSSLKAQRWGVLTASPGASGCSEC